MILNEHFHTTYCTNIHPGADWDTTFRELRTYLPSIKAEVSPEEDFGIGLRLSNQASEELGSGNRLQEFKSWLNDSGCYVFTMNGFPYGNFHGEVVKDKVHHPDWTKPERVSYTKRLFEQLAILLPEGMEGGISTSPISYTHWHTAADIKAQALRKGSENLAEIVLHLYNLEANKGTYMHLDLEPEPDGMLENSNDVVHFFREVLEPVALPILEKELQTDRERSRELLYRYINICYDVCHFSLAYEQPEASFKKFREAGIRIGKVQLSSALRLPGGEGAGTEALRPFDESVYLHQVTERIEGGVRTYRDLPEVLGKVTDFRELRAHFHVPIFLEKFGSLYATQEEVCSVLDYLKTNPVCQHLEVETYTWEVLPQPLRIPLKDSIIRELQWVKDNF